MVYLLFDFILLVVLVDEFYEIFLVAHRPLRPHTALTKVLYEGFGRVHVYNRLVKLEHPIHCLTVVAGGICMSFDVKSSTVLEAILRHVHQFDGPCARCLTVAAPSEFHRVYLLCLHLFVVA